MKMTAKAKNAIGPSEDVEKEFVKKPFSKGKSNFMKMMKNKKKGKK